MGENWPWMLFKVAGGTILAQAGPIRSGETFLIRNLTELKVVDPRKAIYEKAADDIANILTSVIETTHNDRRKQEAKRRAQADQDAAEAVEEAKRHPPVYEAQPDPVGQFLSEPILMNADQIVWSAPANEATAKLCGEFWAAREAKA